MPIVALRRQRPGQDQPAGGDLPPGNRFLAPHPARSASHQVGGRSGRTALCPRVVRDCAARPYPGGGDHPGEENAGERQRPDAEDDSRGPGAQASCRSDRAVERCSVYAAGRGVGLWPAGRPAPLPGRDAVPGGRRLLHRTGAIQRGGAAAQRCAASPAGRGWRPGSTGSLRGCTGPRGRHRGQRSPRTVGRSFTACQHHSSATDRRSGMAAPGLQSQFRPGRTTCGEVPDGAGIAALRRPPTWGWGRGAGGGLSAGTPRTAGGRHRPWDDAHRTTSG